ncbi:MAG: DUF2070 family protein [Thermoplasmata archaeon]
MSTDPVLHPMGASRPAPKASSLLFRAPKPPLATLYILGASAALAVVLWAPSWSASAEAFALIFLLPALVAGVLTPSLAHVLGGRFEFQRSLFLALMVLLIELPIAVVGRVGLLLVPSYGAGVWAIVLFLQGPALWFRHLSLYGVSSARHHRSIIPAALQPVLAIALTFLLVAPSTPLLLAAAIFLVVGFLCAMLLLRVVDRPIRRGFQSSGLSMMRPLIDHVNRRDPAATGFIEGFFLKSAKPADLRVTVVRLGDAESAVATIALPTVHPGPFGAIGASDLPRKLREAMGPRAGTVFVPHTPCDHDLDLPSEAETAKIGAATRSLLEEIASRPGSRRGSPLVLPYEGSLARAQILGETALVLITQAPLPTDDISYAVADRIIREIRADGGPPVALVDAHNSYVEDEGDVHYATPIAEKLARDAKAAVRAALAQAKEGGIEVGCATITGYDIARDGIAPEGMRALVVRCAGSSAAYLLIDGNNLVRGLRDPIVARLLQEVDAAEVMTTDNHVVHEADGSINPVGERYPKEAMLSDAEHAVHAAIQRLRPVTVTSGQREVPGVLVLGPGFTSRLLTAISDTVSMLGNSLVMTLLLLLASSLVVLFALR